MLGNTMAMLAQVVVAPRRPIPADDVDFAVRMPKLDQQIMQEVELLQVIRLHVTGAMVAKKMIQLRDTIRQVLITDAVDHVEVLAGVQVIESQPVGSQTALSVLGA